MFLVVDIGNTNIVIGAMEDKKILFEARIATNRKKTTDEYAMEILKILSLERIDPEHIQGCILSSVVPPVQNAVCNGLTKILHKRPLIVGPGLKTGLKIQMDNPRQVGSDRIVIAVGALAKYKAPLILMDLGTATTMEVINRDNTYIGGCIIPGVRTSLDALTANAAQLPGISLEIPPDVIGSNTVDCIRSGILHGTAAMIDGMVERLEGSLGEPATVIATGGLAPLVLPLCRRKILLEKDLLLEGLSILYEKNARKHF